MAELRIGVIGATSLVGGFLLSRLRRQGWPITAFSRRQAQADSDVSWVRLGDPAAMRKHEAVRGITHWICVAPVWVLSEYLSMLEVSGARRVIVLSSTSRFTKDTSSDAEEQGIARRLIDAEERVQAWARDRAVEWVILRPTLIYGKGEDKNVSEMARLIRRFGFFPLFGRARGLRQPVHADDVAQACMAAVQAPAAANRAFNLSGGETLAYCDMAARIFDVLGRKPRLLVIPLWAFRAAMAGLCLLPRYRHWSAAMAERMNRDLVFDHAEATTALDFHPRRFTLTVTDLPA